MRHSSNNPANMALSQERSAIAPCLRHLTSLCWVALLCVPVCRAGQATADAAAGWTENAVETPAANVNVLPSEGLGADDLLEIRVSYCPELSRNFRVSSDGTLSLPLVRKTLMVAGLTPIQVSTALQDELVGEHLLVDPTVSVSVLEYRSRPVSVVGAVNHPLTFQATGQITLLDAIAQAGGLSPNAGGSIIVTTSSSATTSSEQKSAQTILVQDLFGGDVPKVNLTLHGGEEIRVPEARKIFIVGNVKRPGMYPMQGDSDTTVVKAIALSEGLDAYGASNAFIYRLHGPGGQRTELKVPLNLILSHKAPDIALSADDILYIPGSDGRRLTSKILNGLAGFGQTAAAGLVIYK
jgi:polysaccharide export outer membrane protein